MEKQILSKTMSPEVSKLGARLQELKTTSPPEIKTPELMTKTHELKTKTQELKNASPLPSTIAPSTSHSVSRLEEAEQVANLYLPDDSPEGRQAFIKAYLTVKADSSALSNVTDMDILSAFMIFKDESDQVVSYLKAFVALRELGFGEEAISAALLLYKNNREEALEHLMKL